MKRPQKPTKRNRKPQAPLPLSEPDRAPAAPERPRWRVYCRGMFVAATRAPTEAEAVAQIAAELVARQAP